ncbi:MAG: DUF5320 domain-containing protein [Anaerolineaceae bacterium]|nr:DUF5320 domain-containing protein [Anaerolineaceae bacterium]
MPARDGKGPNSEGPLSGRGMGNCTDSGDNKTASRPGFFGRRGMFGGGINRRNRFFQSGRSLNNSQENNELNNKISSIESTIEDLKNMIQNLNSKG